VRTFLRQVRARVHFRYLLPRPLRLTLLGGGAVSCFVAAVISASQVAKDLSYQIEPDFVTLLVNIGGLLAFVLLFLQDQAAASTRLRRRREVHHLAAHSVTA
jgi:hypothetical protein